MSDLGVARRVRGASVILFLLLFMPLVGCGHAKGKLSGKVTYRGTALPGGSITIVPENGTASQTVSAKIESDGSYSAANVPAGAVKVGIRTLEPAPFAEARVPPSEVGQGKDGLKGRGTVAQPTVKLPPEYSDPDKSGLRYTITGGSQVQDIDLK
jgi:hypothetical protein